ncbi:G-protein coupled receptor Mth2-like isoform X3 [Bacillus rossius redtenbacheri]|uniref:G-protein coupled receptor Mth2-like isoform X3 n=1 Tax=Bacillus rossius redtenbacheri TaxID=93214 RepID=UPI002FDCDAA9
MKVEAALWLSLLAWRAARACDDPDAACFRKCCPAGERASTEKKGACEPLPQSQRGFAPRVHRLPDLAPVDAGLPAASSVVYGDPCEHGKFSLDPAAYDDDAFFLLADGRLYVPGHLNSTFNVSQFCVEASADGAVQAFLCFKHESYGPDEPDESREPLYVVYPVGMLISLPFLAVTLVVYAAVPQLRNLHGRALMSYVVSLIVAYTCLVGVQLLSSSLAQLLCLMLAFIIYFSFLASFFWLNVMCFDIWWTFSGFRPLRGSEKEREHKKFVMYSVYAWGSSSLLLLVCLLTDRHPYVRERVLSPQFGKDRCWFTTQSAEAAYFYGPMGLIVLCNIVLFVLTALRIVKLKKETAMLKGEESRRHDVEENKQRFVLYLKLFVVMGVNWGMEVISFAAGGPQYIWYITDIGNTLQGVLIFLIFVWKEKIRRLLAKRLCPRLARGSGRPGSQTRGTLSKSVATPSSSYSITTKTTCNGETSRMAREESDVV